MLLTGPRYVLDYANTKLRTCGSKMIELLVNLWQELNIVEEHTDDAPKETK